MLRTMAIFAINTGLITGVVSLTVLIVVSSAPYYLVPGNCNVVSPHSSPSRGSVGLSCLVVS